MIAANQQRMVVESQSNPLAETPKIDYNKIMNGGAREEIIQAMKDYSFFYIVNIPNFDPQAELDVMEQFFSQSQETKEKYASIKNNPNNANILRGT